MLRAVITSKISWKTGRDLKFIRSLTQDNTSQNVTGSESADNIPTDQDLYVDPHEEEEIEMKRNKNRLPERVYRRFVKKEALRPELKTDFTAKRLRLFYGRFGQGSGLNPGIAWPTREELESRLERDQFCHPSLEQSLKEIAEEKATKQKEREEYEREVEANMAKHSQWLKDHYARIAKKEASVEEAKRKRQDLIDEISDYLGYEVDPSDPRFKEAVEQKEKEKKKALKLKKQQESYNKLLQRLSEIAKKQEKDDKDDDSDDDEQEGKK